MSGTRLTRSGRCRFVVGIVALVLMFGFFAILHSSQQQLEDSRQQLLRCEQQQEALNVRLQAIVEEKFHLEKNLETVRKEHLEIRQHLEQKAKEHSEKLSKSNLESNIRFDRLKQSFKLLQNEHGDLVGECLRSKKQLSQQINGLENKVQSSRSELQKEKSLHSSQVTEWTEKYNTIVREKERMEILLKTTDAKSHHERVRYLERVIEEYKSKCAIPETKKLNSAESNFISQKPKAMNQRSFTEQKLVSADLYKISVKVTNTTQPDAAKVSSLYSPVLLLDSTTSNSLLSAAASPIQIDAAAVDSLATSTYSSVNRLLKSRPLKLIAPSTTFSTLKNNGSLVINSVENFQIVPKPEKKKISGEAVERKSQSRDHGKMVSPLSSPLKHSSDEKFEAVERATLDTNMTTSISSTPLQNIGKFNPYDTLQHQNSHKQIPLGVAPIPQNFDDLIKNDQNHIKKKIDDGYGESEHNKKIDDIDNNRYANVLKDIGSHSKVDKSPVAAAIEPDSDGLKDHGFNDQNFNLPEEDNNFFDTNFAGGIDKNRDNLETDEKKDENNLGNDNAGRNRLLDGENLNIEVAGDQGKELPDGLHLEDGNDEDEDEDDYSNPAARLQEGQAIRN